MKLAHGISRFLGNRQLRRALLVSAVTLLFYLAIYGGLRVSGCLEYREGRTYALGPDGCFAHRFHFVRESRSTPTITKWIFKPVLRLEYHLRYGPEGRLRSD